MVSDLGRLSAAVDRSSELHSARNTTLLRNGFVFYPKDDQIDPDVLPRLSDAQIATIEQILLAEARDLQQAQRDHAVFLASRFPGHDSTRVPSRVHLTAYDGPEAGSDSDTGDVQVSARVIQATFRAAVVATFFEATNNQGADVYGFDPVVGDGVASRDPALVEIERRSFQAYRFFRQRLNTTPASRQLDPRDAQNLEAAGRVFDEMLADSLTVQMSHQLEAAFLNAIRFMLAHELGHVALHHPRSPADCDEALANEATADRYATILSGLAAYKRAKPIVLRKGASPGFTTEFEPPDKLTSPADGASEFFRFGYTLAGFNLALGRLPGCEYPGPRARFGALSPYSHVYFKTFERAATDRALKRYGNRKTKLSYRGHDFFDRFFTSLPRIVAHNNESLGKDDIVPDDLETERSTLSEIYHAVFNQA